MNLSFFLKLLKWVAPAAALVLFACAPKPRIEPDNLFWPLPPDEPRIKYVQSISSEDDIGRVYTFREKLFGKDYDHFLYRPYGVFARGTRIFATDIVRRQVLIFDLLAQELLLLDDQVTLVTPADVASDESGAIYVADAGTDSVKVFDPDGKYRSSIIIDGCKPVSLAIDDKRGRIYVADRKRHLIVVLNLKGKELFTIGGRGTDDGKFNMPLSLALDRSGDLYVLDRGNFRIQHFGPDGRFRSQFGAVGDGLGQFANPKGLALDSDGHIYVTDAAFSNIQIFDPDGKILLAVGGLGVDPGFLYLPADISIDAYDRIYVADQFNSRLQVFQYLKPSTP